VLLLISFRTIMLHFKDTTSVVAHLLRAKARPVWCFMTCAVLQNSRPALVTRRAGCNNRAEAWPPHPCNPCTGPANPSSLNNHRPSGRPRKYQSAAQPASAGTSATPSWPSICSTPYLTMRAQTGRPGSGRCILQRYGIHVTRGGICAGCLTRLPRRAPHTPRLQNPTTAGACRWRTRRRSGNRSGARWESRWRTRQPRPGRPARRRWQTGPRAASRCPAPRPRRQK